MKFKPLGARVVTKEVEGEETTESGIVLPDTAREKPQTAEVVAVGDHEDVKVSIGDVVVLRKYSGTEVELGGEEHRIVNAEDILGVNEGYGFRTESHNRRLAPGARSALPLFTELPSLAHSLAHDFRSSSGAGFRGRPTSSTLHPKAFCTQSLPLFSPR